MLEVSDGPTGGDGGGGGGVIWGMESADDNRDASEKGLGEVNNPRVGSAGDDLWYMMVRDTGMDTEGRSSMCRFGLGGDADDAR